MNQATHTILVATAIAEVAKCYESFVDFDAEKTEGRAFMEAAAQSLGLAGRDGRREYDKGFEDFKRDMLATFEQKATVELKSAVSEAEAEQRTHAHRLSELRKLHSETMQMLADHHEKSIPEDADDDFVRLINSSHEEMTQAAERFHREFMDIVQTRHRLELERCFVCHLVGEETAKKLVELYEVK